MDMIISGESEEIFPSSVFDWFIRSGVNQSESSDITKRDVISQLEPELGNVSSDWPNMIPSTTSLFRVAMCVILRRGH